MRSGSTDPAMKKARAALMIYLALIFPLSAVLPPWVSFENGPVENAQAVILAAFGVMCVFFFKHGASAVRRMWLPSAGIFFILTARELSWGRVFFTEGYSPETGPIIIASSKMPYYTEIHAAVGVVLLLCLYGFVRYVPWKRVLKEIPLPLPEILLLAVCVTLATLGDHGSMFGHTIRDQQVEELSELLMYLTLGHTALYYYRRLNALYEK